MANSENQKGYTPAQEFVQLENDSLLDFNFTDSTELWLLQVPFSNDFLTDIDGKEVSVKLDNDGQLTSFEGSSGKVYDFISFDDQEPDETVFVPSSREPKIAGKISRRISVVHYPDPKERQKTNSPNSRLKQRNSSGVSATNSQYFPMQSGYPQTSQSGRAASSKGSNRKSSLSEFSEPSSTAKRRLSKSILSEDPSNGTNMPELTHGHSSGISAMSSDHSHGGKSKRRKH
ncbi:hypothetical protein Lal_00004220 [Lupinus albus]|uniref:Uncharacterized protein n=1 Tax=Lupinus albus TaxID=3870 RepID=A0A6A4P9E1_LUPAL|nr:hypothetical protein Lalb_Chr15g0079851 [Lupinus albus]KAF1894296.1 hypothetical protein Lal_00004220 [Lupinus albus]